MTLDSNLQKYLDADQYLERSLSLYSTNKVEEAMDLIDKAIECDPNLAVAYNRKGDCLIKLGRIEEALACYEKSHELNPNIQNNYFDLGRTHLILGHYEKALENFKIANDMRPQSDIHAFIGKIYFDQDKFDEAKSSFENVLGVDKKAMSLDLSENLTLKGKKEEQKKEEKENDSFFRKAINKIKSANSSLANFYISLFTGKSNEQTLCSNLSETEKTDLIKAAKQVVIASGNTMALYYYAQILCKEGKTEEAKKYFDKIIEKYSMILSAKKDAAEAYYYIGKSYFFIGDYLKAVENLKKAVELDTDKIYNHYSYEMFYTDAEALASLAEAQSKAGHISEAGENIKKAIALEPNNKKLVDLKRKLGY